MLYVFEDISETFCSCSRLIKQEAVYEQTERGD